MSKDSDPAITAIPGYTSGTWKLDAAHSDIAFSVRNLLITTVTGRFTRFDVTIVTGEDPLGSSVTATIELASVDTRNEKRDEHLRSEAFFDVAEHPRAGYRSTGIRRVGAGWIIDGELTLRGITRSVPLSLTTLEFDAGPNGDRRATCSATAHVNRGEFGLDRWSGGGLVSSKTVPISIEVHIIRQ